MLHANWNDETRAVREWIDIDESRYWQGVAQEVWDHEADGPASTRIERATDVLAQSLENHVADSAPEDTGDVYGLLLSNALGQVDWQQIARSLIDHVN